MLRSNIKDRYQRHSCVRVCQGDILRDFSFSTLDAGGQRIEVELPYIIVTSQDCDLQRAFETEKTKSEGNGIIKNNQFLPNVLFLPMFTEQSVKDGSHLERLYKIKQDQLGGDRWKKILNNKDDRYHCIEKDTDLQIPSLIVDFKHYFTLPLDIFSKTYKTIYLATLNELFREHLSQRFASYLNRIGLPDIKSKTAS